jgi:hypothetical protein
MTALIFCQSQCPRRIFQLELSMAALKMTVNQGFHFQSSRRKVYFKIFTDFTPEMQEKQTSLPEQFFEPLDVN